MAHYQEGGGLLLRGGEVVDDGQTGLRSPRRAAVRRQGDVRSRRSSRTLHVATAPATSSSRSESKFEERTSTRAHRRVPRAQGERPRQD
jgi:hypothetical protein